MSAAPGRSADYPIEPLFLERWSTRAFDGTGLDDVELRTLLEAGRWAPSSYNSQPWRFLYAKRDTPHWQPFLSLLTDFNRSWAQRASVLIVVVSKLYLQPPNKPEPELSHTHSFDAGAAWVLIALQATRMGFLAHAVCGMDFERARIELNVPEGYRVEAAIVIGRPGDKSVLPEHLQAREKPSGRHPLSASMMEGGFPVA